jgi:hypothetical protein
VTWCTSHTNAIHIGDIQEKLFVNSDKNSWVYFFFIDFISFHICMGAAVA